MLLGYEYFDTTTEETVIETVTEYITENSESDYICLQVSEINDYVSVIADNTTVIRQEKQVEIVLIFAVICVIGVVCGLLGALTWRSNIK